MAIKNLFVTTLFLALIVGCSETGKDTVPFLHETPIIDGQLDANLTYLPKREFNHIWQFDNPVTDTVPVTYRMAYTPTHLYLCIEAETDSINYRRRGFINGDGFKLLLAKPQQDSLTDEYYDLVFSASQNKKYWARKRIWEYNHDQSYNRSLNDASMFEAASKNGITGFEALIAWEEVPPYHPWFMEKMGYNLYFAKALGDTITNGYAVVSDDGIWNEEVPKRNHTQLNFEIPQKVVGQQLQFQLKQRNSIVGQRLEIETVAISPMKETLSLTVQIKEKGQLLQEQSFTIETSKVFQKEKLSLHTEKLSEGAYELLVDHKGTAVYSSEFTVLPDIDLNQVYESVKTNPQGVGPGAQHTLMYKIQQYEKGIDSLKDYETAESLLKQYETGSAEFNQFMNGIDPYAEKEGVYRRAFLSKQDSTYQPYSIKLPIDYNPKNKYPLLVFLHGSGSTDEGLLNAARSGGNFIEIAPYGRDTYDTYASPKSQKDITEAIDDVSKHFSVDTENIIIGGFSMGGYGALRTFYENPSLYKGVAVHAGHPNLANYWLGNGFPNFMKRNYLEPFKGKKVFIYHGEKDGSLPVRLIKEMAKKMKEMNIDVTLCIVATNGHEYPDEATNNRYFNWLNMVVQ